jgi:hypothetical protein
MANDERWAVDLRPYLDLKSLHSLRLSPTVFEYLTLSKWKWDDFRRPELAHVHRVTTETMSGFCLNAEGADRRSRSFS